MAVVGSLPEGAGFGARGRCSGMARVGGSFAGGGAALGPPARRSPNQDSISRLPVALEPRAGAGGGGLAPRGAVGATGAAGAANRVVGGSAGAAVAGVGMRVVLAADGGLARGGGGP